MKLSKIPECATVFLDSENTAEFAKTIDDFFVNTKEYLKEVNKAKSFDFEIKVASLKYGSIKSDDIITYLSYMGKYVVAGVIETRTEFNNLRYTFFRDLSCLDKSTSP